MDYYLSDSAGDLRKWRLPEQTLPAGGRVVFDEIGGFHNPVTAGFGLNKAGEQVLLSYLPGSSEDRVVDAVSFKGQVETASWGRFPDAAPWWYATAPTRNQPNTAGRMYRPSATAATDETVAEYLEIHNPLPTPVTLADTNGSWRLDGGIDFVFPAGTVIAPGEAALVVSFDPADATTLATFKSQYAIPGEGVRILGPYTGKLSNRSDRVALERAQAPETAGEGYSWVIVDEVIYANQEPWPVEANGTGRSLSRLSFATAGNDPTNWTAAEPTPGAVTSPALDSDNDGMPDAWEVDKGFDPFESSDAYADADSDGSSNLSEYLSGTDPLDARNALRLEASQAGSRVLLRFQALANRTYTIEYRGSAGFGGWQILQEVAAAPEPRTVEVNDEAPSAESRYYRLVTPALR
jgi:hypothetical protein